ncbi:MAG TPA: serine acetyltransferase [Clostridiaceae bacterium]|nr:serine acetyltransferase [Clostridiaceae bacterium]
MEKNWLNQIVNQMTDSYTSHPDLMETDSLYLPDRDIIIECTHILRDLLFPGYFSSESVTNNSAHYYIGNRLTRVYEMLTKQVQKALCHAIRSYDGNGAVYCQQDQHIKAAEIVEIFISKLPSIQALLTTDVEAAYNGDPAATSYAEVILSYPGVMAITIHRLAHELYILRVPLLPRIMSEYAHSETGIDIHPGADIGAHFFIDHGTGVVIGETTVIGHHTKIYQGVTLGALSTRAGQKLRHIKRHPTLGNHVTVYGGATILGGETVIGNNVTIGGNVFITKSINHSTKVMMKGPNLEFN